MPENDTLYELDPALPLPVLTPGKVIPVFPSSLILCGKCGAKIDLATANFCSSCGNRVRETCAYCCQPLKEEEKSDA